MTCQVKPYPQPVGFLGRNGQVSSIRSSVGTSARIPASPAATPEIPANTNASIDTLETNTTESSQPLTIARYQITNELISTMAFTTNETIAMGRARRRMTAITMPILTDLLDLACHHEAMPIQYVPVRQDAKKMAYIEWLTTPPHARVPSNEKELAKQLDVYHKTLYNWRHDREFREVWQDNTDAVIGGEDRRQAVMDALYQAASDDHNPRHVQAAKLYLDAIDKMSPTKNNVKVSHKALGMLTDEEIETLMARGIAEQQAAENADRSG